jgi:hypothetical protein
MPDPERVVVLLTGWCEWCSTGLYKRRSAELEVFAEFGAYVRLCRICAEKIPGPRLPLVPIAATLPMLEPAEVAAYLAAQTWTPAKSVPEYPHSYVLLSRSADPLTHLRVHRFIRAKGERRQWKPATGPAAGSHVWCHYWTAGDYEYWSQPAISDPILNRKPADATR